MRYERYKEVDLPWLQEVPEHWELVRNKHVLIPQKRIVGDNFSDYVLLSLTLRGIIERDIESGKGKFPESFEKYKVVNRDDLIFCLFDIDETPRTVGISKNEGMITGAYDVYKSLNSNPNFLAYYWIKVDNEKALKPYYKSLRKTITSDSFLSIRMPLPPLHEQEQIANFLDWKINEINKLIEQEKKKIALFENLNNTIIRNKISEVSVFRNVPLKRVCSVIAGKEISVEVDSENSEAVRVFGSGDKVFKYTNNHLLDGEFIIFGRKGTIGKPYIVEGKLWIVDTAYAMKNNHLTDFKYLYYLMKIFPWEDFATNTVKPSIVANQILMQKIILPEIDVQIEVARNIDNLIEKNKELVEVIQHKIIELDNLKQSLISSVVTGKIDIRDIVIPEYEKVESIFEEDEDQVEGGEDEWD